MNYTEETAIIILNASNDERSGGEEFVISPPLSIWGERIMYYINYIIQKNIRNRKFKFSSSFKVSDFLRDLDMVEDNRKVVKKEIVSRRILNSFIEYSMVDKQSLRQALIKHPLLKELTFDHGKISFEVHPDYVNRNITKSVNSFFITTIEEVKGYGRPLSFKLARWIKTRTNSKLNFDKVPQHIHKEVKKIRQAFKSTNPEMIKEALTSVYEEAGKEFDENATYEEHIRKLTGWNAAPYIHYITLDEIRTMLYGTNKADWGYRGIDLKTGQYKMKGNQKVHSTLETQNFINGVIKKSLLEINEYSIFNVSLPVYQETDEDDPYNKTLKIVVSPKPFILSEEAEKIIQGTKQNIKLAVLQNYFEHNSLEIKSDIPKIDISEEMRYAASQINNLDEIESKGEMLHIEVQKIRTGERELVLDKSLRIKEEQDESTFGDNMYLTGKF